MTDGTTLSASDVALLSGRNNGMFGGDGIGMLALFFLFSMMGWGGFGDWGGFGRNGEPVTEAGLCNAMNFNNLENAVGRGFDQQAQFAFQNQRDLCTGFASTNAAINQARFENQNCCCETQKQILENRYLAEKNASDFAATVVAQVQSVKDMLCQQEAARKDARIWQLELNQAFCGVPRFQPGTVYGSIPVNPFFGNWNNCGNCCGNGNI